MSPVGDLGEFHFSLDYENNYNSIALCSKDTAPTSLDREGTFPCQFVLPFSSVQFEGGHLFLSSGYRTVLSGVTLVFVFSMLSRCLSVSYLCGFEVLLYDYVAFPASYMIAWIYAASNVPPAAV